MSSRTSPGTNVPAPTALPLVAADPRSGSDGGRSERPSDDASRLMVLIVVITGGALIVVTALWAAAAIDTSWALAAVMAVHLATTTVVFAVVAYVIFGRAPVPNGHHLHRLGTR